MHRHCLNKTVGVRGDTLQPKADRIYTENSEMNEKQTKCFSERGRASG